MPEMVINLGDSCIGNAPYLKDAISLKKACLSGIKTQHFNCNHTGLFHLLGVRFRPTGLCKFFDFEGTDIKSHIYTIEDIMGNSFDTTYEKICTSETILESVKVLETWLLQRLKKKEVWDDKIDDAISKIKNLSHNLEDIVSYYQCSHKQFIYQFKRTTGILPSQLEQIIRFQQLIVAIQSSTQPDWQEIIYKNGYYDQSHLIRSFKKFTGLTPSEYHKVAHLSQQNIAFFD
jgi:AraC-like DNA-binding protein